MVRLVLEDHAPLGETACVLDPTTLVDDVTRPSVVVGVRVEVDEPECAGGDEHDGEQPLHGTLRVSDWGRRRSLWLAGTGSGGDPDG